MACRGSSWATPGRVHLLVYWSPECPECVHEPPRLAWLQARERNLAVASVTYPRLRDEAAAFAKSKSLGFPILLDAGGRVAKLCGVLTTPTVYVVFDGRAVVRHTQIARCRLALGVKTRGRSRRRGSPRRRSTRRRG